jgi:transmembrane sensor
MNDLILAALQGRASRSDLKRLEEFRSASPANEDAYQQAILLWHASAGADPHMPRVSDPPADLMRRLRTRPPAHPLRLTLSHSPRRPRWLVPGMTAAAGVVATLTLVSLAGNRESPTPSVPELSVAEFATDSLETATTRLEDGSVVRLASNSRLSVMPNRNRREVFLEGEGYFAIAHDPAKPFRVRTRIGSIEVLGTQFDARVEGSNLRVVVTDGTVALTTPAGRVLVPAGHVASAGDDLALSVAAAPNPESLLDWMGGTLIFQDLPITDVARQLERRYGIRVLLPDSDVASRRVTAWFTQQDVEQVLAAVCRAVEAECTLSNGIATILP